MKSITFYSYKGGVGRSLALSNIAIRLSELGKKVCLLDFDLEAPGLHYKFGKYSFVNKIKRGIVDYIYKFQQTENTEELIKDYSIELKPRNKFATPIHLIPAGKLDDSDYWKNLSKIEWANLFYTENSIGIKFFLDLKEKIKKELNPDFLLIDSRTGITDIAGITLKILADEIVILAANNQENIDGSIRIIRNLFDDKADFLNINPKINFILTRVPFSKLEKAKENALIERLNNRLLTEFPQEKIPISIIHSDRRLEENEQHLIGDEVEADTVSISNDYLNIFDLLCSKELNPEEIESFKKRKKSEKLFERAINAKASGEKIAFLKEALSILPDQENYLQELAFEYYNSQLYESAESLYLEILNRNSENLTANIHVADIYISKKEYHKAKPFLEKALESSSENRSANYSYAFLLEKLNEDEKALYILNNFLSKNASDPDFLNSRADIFRKRKMLDNAIKDIKKAIITNPEVALYYGTLAEIYFEMGRKDDFLFNFSIGISKGLSSEELNSAKDVYVKLKDDSEFLKLINDYGLDINEILK